MTIDPRVFFDLSVNHLGVFLYGEALFLVVHVFSLASALNITAGHLHLILDVSL